MLSGPQCRVPRSIGVKGEKSAVGTINVGSTPIPAMWTGGRVTVMGWPKFRIAGYLRDHFQLGEPKV
jgi:hypothetical protein